MAIENQLVEGFVIFDTDKKDILFCWEGTVTIDDYSLETQYKNGDYEIAIQYLNEP